MAFKLLLVAVDGTIVGPENKIEVSIVEELGALAAELHAHGVRIALWSTREWTYAGASLDDYMTRLAGVQIMAHGYSIDGSPPRRQSGSADVILGKYAVARHETVLLGGTHKDMIAGVQNKLLHLRCDWYGKQSNYGLEVADVASLRRFCLVFALRKHSIFWRHDNENLDISAAGPFSTMKEAYALFGADAKSAAKHGTGHPEFWFLIAASSLYFSGALAGVHYICSYPGHKAGVSPIATDSQAYVLARLGQCMRINYYHDLILRHRDAEKSQLKQATAREFLNQINTIKLNRHPHRNLQTTPNTSPLSLKGKLVLVVDDITTSGKSLDTARAYIEAAGGKTRLFSWLKTINTSYTRMDNPEIKPYSANNLSKEPSHTNFSYNEGIVDQSAPIELNQALENFKKFS